MLGMILRESGYTMHKVLTVLSWEYALCQAAGLGSILTCIGLGAGRNGRKGFQETWESLLKLETQKVDVQRREEMCVRMKMQTI